MLDVTFIANYKNALNFVNASYVKKKNLCVPVFRVRLHFLKHGLIKHV